MTITVQEAAKRLGVSNDSIKRKIYKGEILAEKIGDKWAIDEESFSKFTINVINKNEKEHYSEKDLEDILDAPKLSIEDKKGWFSDNEFGTVLVSDSFDKTLTISNSVQLSPGFSITNWVKFNGVLSDRKLMFKNNGFKPNELIFLADDKLALPACFNENGNGGVFELPPYSPIDFKYDDFKPIRWAKWLEVPEEMK